MILSKFFSFGDFLVTFMDYIVTTNNIDLSLIKKSRSRMFEDIVLNNGS